MVHLAWAILEGMLVLLVILRGSIGGGETQVLGEGSKGDSGFLQGSYATHEVVVFLSSWDGCLECLGHLTKGDVAEVVIDRFSFCFD